MAFTDPRLHRRSLLALASAVTASGMLGRAGIAQEATTEATPGSAVQTGDKIPPEIANAADTDWPVEGRTLSMERSVTGSSITAETVSGLAEAWTMAIEAPSAYGALVANPIISGETLFLQDANSNVYALNRETGEEIWSNMYGAQVPSGGPNGIAVGYGVLVYPVGNAGVVAADMATGEEIWNIDITGIRNEGITTAPLIYDNKVWISTIPGSIEGFYAPGQRGIIHVIDVTNGEILWYFDTVVDNLWGNPSVNSGGGFWHPPAVDSEGNMFISIANGAPYPGTEEYPSGSSREGDNDFANNVISLDTDTGGLVWNVNITGRDIFDLDNQLSPIVGTVEWDDGYTRELVFTTGKHAYVVALDPVSGAQHWRTPVGTHRNAHLQEIPEGEEIVIQPNSGVLTPFAYQGNKVFAALSETVRPVSSSESLASNLTEATGLLVALDARNGDTLWEVVIPTGALAGATVVNDLVFTGALDGVLRAYNIEDGSLVWSVQTTSGLNAPIAISGDYVYVPAGGPLIPSEDTSDPAPEYVAQLIAYKLG